jgi:hypothetical protein
VRALEQREVDQLGPAVEVVPVDAEDTVVDDARRPFGEADRAGSS